MNKCSFYGNKRPNIQKGIYNLLVVKRKIPVDDVISYIEVYKKLYIKRDTPATPVGNAFVLDHIAYNFGSFLEVVNKETNQTFKFNKNKKVEEECFEEWF